MHTSSSCLLFGAAVEFEPIELDELVDDPDVVEPSLPLPFGDFEFGTTKSLESSCFTSNNAARPMLSLVMTRFNMSSEPVFKKIFIFMQSSSESFISRIFVLGGKTGVGGGIRKGYF